MLPWINAFRQLATSAAALNAGLLKTLPHLHDAMCSGFRVNPRQHTQICDSILLVVSRLCTDMDDAFCQVLRSDSSPDNPAQYIDAISGLLTVVWRHATTVSSGWERCKLLSFIDSFFNDNGFVNPEFEAMVVNGGVLEALAALCGHYSMYSRGLLSPQMSSFGGHLQRIAAVLHDFLMLCELYRARAPPEIFTQWAASMPDSAGLVTWFWRVAQGGKSKRKREIIVDCQRDALRCLAALFALPHIGSQALQSMPGLAKEIGQHTAAARVHGVDLLDQTDELLSSIMDCCSGSMASTQPTSSLGRSLEAIRADVALAKETVAQLRRQQQHSIDHSSISAARGLRMGGHPEGLAARGLRMGGHHNEGAISAGSPHHNGWLELDGSARGQAAGFTFKLVRGRDDDVMPRPSRRRRVAFVSITHMKLFKRIGGPLRSYLRLHALCMIV